jgi:hypothetical protein
VKFQVNPNKAVTELCKLALKYGSDKTPAIFHNYTPYYHQLLNSRRDKVKRVLEIGIGYPETMGHTDAKYTTGASLYMWRDYFPNAEIFALDNRRDILLSDDRIKSFYCDQSSEESLRDIARHLLVEHLGTERFDLIIDDGSHKPEDQALSARMLAPLLADDGYYIIEDVLEPAKTTLSLPMAYEVRDFHHPQLHDDRVVVMRRSPMNPVAVVVLTKYQDVFNGFHDSLIATAPDVPVVCVKDGSVSWKLSAAYKHWQVLDGPEKFSMAGNGNLGLRAVPVDHDILYCGDDIRFTDPETISKLQQVMREHPEVGILSPRLNGRSSPALAYPQSACDYVFPLGMWFPCVYIRRELIDKIGYLDERFNDFGSDDLDYNIRAELAGYKLAVTNVVEVNHEADPATGGPTTFVRDLGKAKWEGQQAASMEKLREKYAVSGSVLSHFLATNDVDNFSRQLAAEMKMGDGVTQPMLTGPATAPGSTRGLEGKSLFIMVPMSHPTMNFIISWTNLLLTLQKYGIPCEYMFLSNESLVTRARNRLADNFRKKTTCTHGLMIDDDIGFDAMDILAMLDLDLEIAGAPCVKKSIRWDRVQEVIKKSNGRQLSADDLIKVSGDFILNFNQFEGKKQFNLGEPQEAHSVGTGLMMARRDTYDRIADAYPDRWYDSSRFDPAALPGRIQDFFQVGVNYESRDYDSEDYRFCIDARKLGMTVWVLPWMKTTHHGAFTFTGDLAKMAELAPEWIL